MKMIKKIATTTLLMLILTGCGIEYRDNPECAKYHYMTFEELRASVTVEEPRAIDNAGKIYIYGDILLVNEKNKGIHIIDNSDKDNPIKKSFVKVHGNIDIAVKDGYMLVDSFMDLVVIDINDMTNIREVNRTKDIFPFNYLEPDFFEYTVNECGFDLDKGIIIGEDDDKKNFNNNSSTTANRMWRGKWKE
jgi:hypothetical protein